MAPGCVREERWVSAPPTAGTLVAPPGESPRARLISELSSPEPLRLRPRGLIASGQAVLSQQLDRAWRQWAALDPEPALPDTAGPEEAARRSMLPAPQQHLRVFLLQHRLGPVCREQRPGPSVWSTGAGDGDRVGQRQTRRPRTPGSGLKRRPDGSSLQKAGGGVPAPVCSGCGRRCQAPAPVWCRVEV